MINFPYKLDTNFTPFLHFAKIVSGQDNNNGQISNFREVMILFCNLVIIENNKLSTFAVENCNFKPQNITTSTSMNKYSFAITFGFLGLLSLATTSCQDEDFGYTAEQIAYRTNFEKAFGKISPDQTWDLSSYNLRQLGLQGGPSASGNAMGTRSAKNKDWNTGGASCNGAIEGATSGSGILKAVGENYYTVEDNTLTWLNKYLTEGTSHTTLGTSFKLVKPENNKDFLIIPVYQGHSGMTWDLHLVAENNSNQLMDYKLWSHSDGFKYNKDYNDGIEFYYNTADEYIGDIYEWAEGGVVKGIQLKRAFPNFESNDISDSDAQLILEVPAGGYVKAIITNKNDISSFDNKDRWNIEVNNTTGSSQKYACNLNGIKNSGWFPKSSSDDMWNLVLYVEWYERCSFDTFADDRVRLYTKYNYSFEQTLTDEDCGSSTQNYINRHTIDRKGVKSKPMRIDCSKIKDELYFYLDVVKGDDYVTGNEDQAETGARQRSDEGMMLALLDNNTTEKLINSSSDLATSVKNILSDVGDINTCEYFVIGCEDANLKDSDWDINDVVFLVVGLDKAPKIKELVKKRYMIEDLGSTFDFDFNDIVVDVTQEKLKNVSDGTYSNTFNNNKGEKTIATLKHLCGTIPFKIQIGNTVLGEDNGKNGKFLGCNAGCAPEGNGCNPESHTSGSGHSSDNYSSILTCEISGWNPETNNIVVTTWPTKAGTTGWSDNSKSDYLGEKDSKTFTFPVVGEFPYIIATDQTVDWMDECVNVPSNWFQTWPTSYDNNPGIHNNGGNSDPEPQPEVYNLSLSELSSGWDATYDSDSKTITYNKEWAGKGWWLSENGNDMSAYNNVIIKLASGVTGTTKVVVEYNHKDNENKYLSSEASIDGGHGYTTIKVVLDNNYKNKVRQIYIQYSEADSIVLREAYLTSADE